MKVKLETALFFAVMLMAGLGALGREIRDLLRCAIAESPAVFIWIAFAAGLLVGYLGG